MRRLIAVCAGGLVIAACSPAITATPTARPTSRFATVAGPVVRQTLPPTWTPSATATASPIPTVTPTLSATPTESAEAICAGFQVLYDFSEKTSYAWGGAIPLFVRLDSPNAAIHFQVTRRSSGEARSFDLPGGQVVGVEFQISALPGPGRYDWVLSARSDTYGDLCSQKGSFLALRPTPTPAATRTPEATEEPRSG